MENNQRPVQTPTGIQSLKNLSFQLIPGVFYLQQVFCKSLECVMDKKALSNQILGIYKFCTDLVIFDREREDRLYVCDTLPNKYMRR